jgi:hypothetical protein
MHTISFDHPNQCPPLALKSKNQIEPRRRDNLKRMAINTAVSEWEKTLPGQAQEQIARLVAEEWKRSGGKGITVNKLNLFRYLRNESGSEKYTAYVMKLSGAIVAAMPIEIARKHGLSKARTEAELVASAIKECSEAHQAKLLGAPIQKLEKEIREAAIALFNMLPADAAGPLLASISAVAPQFF